MFQVVCDQNSLSVSVTKTRVEFRYWYNSHNKAETKIALGTIHYGNTGCLVFKRGGTKLDRSLPKNQHTQRKLLNFENWVNGKVSKIRRHFRNKSRSILKLSKKVDNKKCAPKLVFFNEKKKLDDL